MLTKAYQIDVQGSFSKISKIFQKNDETVIGFSHANMDIQENLHSLQDPNNGGKTNDLSTSATCDEVPCGTMAQYERSQNVVWMGIQLENTWVIGTVKEKRI